MYSPLLVVTVLLSILNGVISKANELTFELPDSAVQCFYEQIEKDINVEMDYQVNWCMITSCNHSC